MLLQALQLAVNLSSETLSSEMLQIVEMLKKGRGGVDWGFNTSSMSNTRKMHIYTLLQIFPLFFFNNNNSPFPFFILVSCFPFPVWLVCIMYLCLYLSLVPSLPFHPFSAGALGHHLTAPANPCISFPIPIPAGLWHGGNEGDIPFLIIYLIQ